MRGGILGCLGRPTTPPGGRAGSENNTLLPMTMTCDRLKFWSGPAWRSKVIIRKPWRRKKKKNKIKKIKNSDNHTCYTKWLEWCCKKILYWYDVSVHFKLKCSTLCTTVRSATSHATCTSVFISPFISYNTIIRCWRWSDWNGWQCSLVDQDTSWLMAHPS